MSAELCSFPKCACPNIAECGSMIAQRPIQALNSEAWQFGPTWTYPKIAKRIEARANASPPLRRDLVIWSSDYMVRIREQEDQWRD